MTTAQKENIKRFKAVQAEAKKLKSKNLKLTHIEAVKQAWKLLYNKGTGSTKKVSVKKSKGIAGVFKFSGVGFKDVRQFDIFGKLSYLIENNEGDLITTVTGVVSDITKQANQLKKYIDKTSFDYDAKRDRDIKKFITQLAKEVQQYNKGKSKTVKPAKEFITVAESKKPIIKKTVAKKTVAKTKNSRQTGTSNIFLDKLKQAKLPGKRVTTKGTVYYESRANRSDKGRLLGVKTHKDTKSHNVNIKVVSGIENNLLVDYKETKKRIDNLEIQAINHKLALKNKENKMYFPQLKKQLLFINKVLKELKTHLKEIKKFI